MSKLEDYIKDLKKFIAENRGKVHIKDVYNWMKKHGGDKIILYTIIDECIKRGIIKGEGNWEESEPLFPLPEYILIREESKKTVETKEAIKLKEAKLSEEEKVFIEYMRKYFSVGILRLKDDLKRKLRSPEDIIEKLEREGLIIYNREDGVVTASEKLMSKYMKPKLHEIL